MDLCTVTDIGTQSPLETSPALLGGASISQETNTHAKKVRRLSGTTSDKHL